MASYIRFMSMHHAAIDAAVVGNCRFRLEDIDSRDTNIRDETSYTDSLVKVAEPEHQALLRNMEEKSTFPERIKILGIVRGIIRIVVDLMVIFGLR